MSLGLGCGILEQWNIGIWVLGPILNKPSTPPLHHSNCSLSLKLSRIHVIVSIVPLRNFPTRRSPHAIV